MNRSRTRFGFVIALLLLAAGLSGLPFLQFRSRPQTAKPVSSALPAPELLQPGTRRARSLRGKEKHFYRVPVSKGQFLRIVVTPNQDHLKLLLSDPKKAALLEADTENGLGGPEPLFLIAETSGEYLLEIQSNSPAGRLGQYRVEAEMRPWNLPDRRRAAASAVFAKGERLYARGLLYAPQAFLAYQEALRLWEGAEEPERQAATLFRLGLSLKQMELYNLALDRFTAVLALLAPQNRHGKAILLDYLGRCRFQIGDSDQAEKLYAESLALFEKLQYQPGIADSLANTALVSKYRGDYAQAVRLYGRSLDLLRSLGDNESQATVLTNLGELYLTEGSFDLAQGSLQGALQALPEVGATEKRSRALLGLGIAQHRLGDVGLALEVLRDAAQLARSRSDSSGEAAALARMAEVYGKEGFLAKAQENALEAYDLITGTENRRVRALVLAALGHVLARLQRPQDALKPLDEAEELFVDLEDRHAVASVLEARALAMQAMGKPEAALENLEESLALVEELKPSAGPEQIDFFATRRYLYTQAIDLLLASSTEDASVRAFEMSERLRARSFVDDVARVREAEPTASPELERLRREIHQVELRRLQAKLSGVADNKLQSLEDHAEVLSSQLYAERSKIRKSTDPYRVDPLSLAEIREEVIGDDTLLLAYFLGEERSLLWAITRSSFRTIVLPKREEIEGQIGRVRESLERSRYDDARYATDLLLADLSKTLLGPVAKELSGRNLLVIPDGPLYLVPFSALHSPLAAVPARETPHYLILDHEIVTLPSASLLATSRRARAGRTPALGEVAILAHPAFSSEPFSEGEEIYPSLPGTAVEAAAISRLVSDRKKLFVASGLDATRETATSPKLADFRILHYATHGFIESRPDRSGLVFSLVDEAGRPRDGFLRAYEIHGLHLPVELVVLSACQTGVNDTRGGDLSGLTRAFLHAGAARVVVSLWNVQDDSTPLLMERFYREMLRQGRTPAAALREAQKAMIDSPASSPYYWAGFVLQGEWQ